MIAAVNPLKPGGHKVLLMKGRLLTIVPVEVPHVALESGVQWALEQVPVERLFVAPLPPLAKFLPHEEEFFAGVDVHVRIQRTQRGGLLPLVAGHLGDERPFAVHHFVM